MIILDLKYLVDEESNGKTVKYILKNKLKLSERLVKKLKYNSRVLCNSIPVFVNTIVNTNDTIEVSIDFDEENEDIIPEDIDIDIIFEDDCFMVLNKKPNIVVHPTSSHPSGTVANAIKFYLNKKGESGKIRPVSRLDRDTSGIIIFAKNQFVQESLIRQMNSRTFKKEYVGIVHSEVKDLKGTIDLPIERKPGSIMLRHVSQAGSPSVTHFEVIEHLRNATYLRFTLETGRTHQIRVHCQAIGHPLIGDTLYTNTGTENSGLINRQALHSWKVNFIHPLSEKAVTLTAPVPSDILRVLEILRK